MYYYVLFCTGRVAPDYSMIIFKLCMLTIHFYMIKIWMKIYIFMKSEVLKQCEN